MTASSKDRYKVTKWVRAKEQGPEMPYREALDEQRKLTKKEGAQDYIYIYTIEESS